MQIIKPSVLIVRCDVLSMFVRVNAKQVEVVDKNIFNHWWQFSSPFIFLARSSIFVKVHQVIIPT